MFVRVARARHVGLLNPDHPTFNIIEQTQGERDMEDDKHIDVNMG